MQIIDSALKVPAEKILDLPPFPRPNLFEMNEQITAPKAMMMIAKVVSFIVFPPLMFCKLRCISKNIFKNAVLGTLLHINYTIILDLFQLIMFF